MITKFFVVSFGFQRILSANILLRRPLSTEHSGLKVKLASIKQSEFSVTDKLLNGIAIAIIQVISPCSDSSSPDECHDNFGPFFGRMMIIFTVLSVILTVRLSWLKF